MRDHLHTGLNAFPMSAHAEVPPIPDRGRDFVAAGWAEILRHNGLADFDALWSLDAGWHEPPNRRRGGWSGVSRLRLRLPAGGEAEVFLKRQEDHVLRSWRHPLRGVATYERELDNIRRYAACGIRTLEPLYFARRRLDGHLRAVFITRALSGFESLQETEPQRIDRRRRAALIAAVARYLAAMHACRLQHRSFYPKHIFVRWRESREPESGAEVEVRVIDLESSRRPRSWSRSHLRDLDSLNRYARGWSRADRLRFLLAYVGSRRATPAVRDLWSALAAMARTKPARETA